MGSDSMEMLEAAAAQEPVSRRLLLAAIARVLGVAAATLTAYALLPIEDTTARAWLVGACFGIAIILTVFARQISRVSRSRRPVLAAVESLVLVFGLFLSLFALLYVSLSTDDPASFTQDIGKVAGLYFTTTVLTTVGFGDISPVSDTARVFVTLQMVLGMVLIGTTFKVLGFSAKRAVTARRVATDTDPLQAAPAPGPGD